MEAEQINKCRQESYERLRNAKSRALQSGPFAETMINILPFVSSGLSRLLFRIAGIKVGVGVKFLGKVKVKLRGRPGNIQIGDYVTLGKFVDLRNRENGRIVLEENVYLDEGVRIVAARDGGVDIGYGSEIGAGTIINSGGKTSIGKFVMIAGNVNLNSSTHGMAKKAFIKEQPHEHGYLKIRDDVWMGAYVSVLMNTEIGEGAIVGANSVVNKDLPPFSISVGAPAKIIRHRE